MLNATIFLLIKKGSFKSMQLDYEIHNSQEIGGTMDINEIIESKSRWLQQDLTYHMDNEWVLNKDKPQNYRNFTYWRQFLYRTPIVYFQIAIRKHAEHKRRSAKSDYFRKKYSVIVAGAECEIPLPIETWEQYREPWDYRTSTYIDPWFAGEKYRYHQDFVEYERSGVSHSTHIRGFDTLNEAKNFAQKWRDFLINDNKVYIDKSVDIMKLIK